MNLPAQWTKDRLRLARELWRFIAVCVIALTWYTPQLTVLTGRQDLADDLIYQVIISKSRRKRVHFEDYPQRPPRKVHSGVAYNDWQKTRPSTAKNNNWWAPSTWYYTPMVVPALYSGWCTVYSPIACACEDVP